ncbi:MAG: hypothetical protein IPQ26_10575 [Elusimicrobia bacterium]|nr:hypothetical protein [Elusimicrobiota bacterium]
MPSKFDTVRLVWRGGTGDASSGGVSTDKANCDCWGGGWRRWRGRWVAARAAHLRIYGLRATAGWTVSSRARRMALADPSKRPCGELTGGNGEREIMGLTNVGAIVAAIQS